MRRQSELRTAGSGVLHSFVSRNSDIGGYWSIGKLYAYARQAQALVVRIDLLNGDISPPCAGVPGAGEPAAIQRLIERYEAMLRRIMTRRGLPRSCLPANDLLRARRSVSRDAGRGISAR